MIQFSELNVQMTLTLGELSEVVALLELARGDFPEGHHPKIIDDIAELYFQMLENLEDGFLGEFEPEPEQ